MKSNFDKARYKKRTTVLFEKKKGIGRLISSQNNSRAGLKNAFLTEPAFRQLCIINSIFLIVAFYVDVTKIERLFLVSSLFLLLIVELLNTAIETTVDRISSDLHPLSKRAKDISGAAQLVAVVMAVVVWLIVLL